MKKLKLPRLIVTLNGCRSELKAWELLCPITLLAFGIVDLCMQEWVRGTLQICFAIACADANFERTFSWALRGKVDSLFDAIKHGDQAHQDWLQKAIDDHFAPDYRTINRAVEERMAECATQVKAEGL